MNKYYDILINNNIVRLKQLHLILKKENIFDKFLSCNKRGDIPYHPFHLNKGELKTSVSYEPGKLTLLQESEKEKIEFIWEKKDFYIKNITFFEDFKNVTSIKIIKKINNFKWIFEKDKVVILISRDENNEYNTAALNNSYIHKQHSSYNRYNANSKFTSIFYNNEINKSISVTKESYDYEEGSPFYFFYNVGLCENLNSNLHLPITDSLFLNNEFPSEVIDFLNITKDVIIKPEQEYFVDINEVKLQKMFFSKKNNKISL